MLPGCCVLGCIVEPGVRSPDRQRVGGRDADEECTSLVRWTFKWTDLLLTARTDLLLLCVTTDILSVAVTSKASRKIRT
jgi:hypothetical protein